YAITLDYADQAGLCQAGGWVSSLRPEPAISCKQGSLQLIAYGWPALTCPAASRKIGRLHENAGERMNKPISSAEIRQAFLDYFEEMGHTIVPSSPLPVEDNPTLFFTNAGMNQFVDTFLGKESRPYKRA